MKITSTQFADKDFIPKKFTCQGEGANPQLGISDVPAAAKSLALVMNDPDAVSGNFIHWILWNMDPATGEIAENSVPQGAVQGTTSAGRIGYTAPCPPNLPPHRYFFRLFALDAKLELAEGSTEVELLKAMQGHIIDQAELIGLYQKE